MLDVRNAGKNTCLVAHRAKDGVIRISRLDLSLPQVDEITSGTWCFDVFLPGSSITLLGFAESVHSSHLDPGASTLPADGYRIFDAVSGKWVSWVDGIGMKQALALDTQRKRVLLCVQDTIMNPRKFAWMSFPDQEIKLTEQECSPSVTGVHVVSPDNIVIAVKDAGNLRIFPLYDDTYIPNFEIGAARILACDEAPGSRVVLILAGDSSLSVIYEIDMNPVIGKGDGSPAAKRAGKAEVGLGQKAEFIGEHIAWLEQPSNTLHINKGLPVKGAKTTVLDVEGEIRGIQRDAENSVLMAWTDMGLKLWRVGAEGASPLVEWDWSEEADGCLGLAEKTEAR